MKRIDTYIEKYFDGTLSEAEERRLKAFLASRKGQASEYDEVRAVMGFFSVGRAVSRKESKKYSRNRMALCWIVAAAAACAAIFITVGVNVSNEENVCVAYFGGRKITDREVIMNDVDKTLAGLFSGESDVDEQLKEIFGK